MKTIGAIAFIFLCLLPNLLKVMNGTKSPTQVDNDITTIVVRQIEDESKLAPFESIYDFFVDK
jgi:hypothetical protein